MEVSGVGSHCAVLGASIQSTCPGLSRLYMFKQMKTRGKGSSYLLEPYRSCAFCFNLFTPGNHTVRLLPRAKYSNRIKKLLQRHKENPKSLGKFQTKVVKDFLSSQNRVAIHCRLCNKTLKLAGQTRTDRQQQKTEAQSQQQKQEITGVDDKVEVEEPKTKKQKKKEKKKMMRKKKMQMTNQEEVNAGLLLDPGIKTEAVSSTGSVSTTPLPNGPLNFALHSSPSPSSSSSSTPLQNSVITKPTSSQDLETRSKSLQNKSSAKKSGNFVHGVGLQTTQKLPDNNQTSCGKKKKLKQQSQQLGNILKREKNKVQPQGASLMDFLSSL